jgi:hypothetical protein
LPGEFVELSRDQFEPTLRQNAAQRVEMAGDGGGIGNQKP